MQREIGLASIVLALSSTVAHGQGAPGRLSDWLLEQPPSAAPYPLGLSWRVPGEVPAQSALRLELLNALAGADRSMSAPEKSRAQLADWLRTLPVTGRVPVSVADARWLQANPARDPRLLPGDSVVLPQRPHTVTVITDSGDLCKVPHSQGYEARAYLEACNPGGASRIDWAWIAQPDGREQRFGIAAWNRQQQDEPAPGAWIWGPRRDSGWTEGFSQKLIAFLATQGPAPDSGEVDGNMAYVSPGTRPRPKQEADGSMSNARGGAAQGLRNSEPLLPSAGAGTLKEAQLPAAPVRSSRGLELTASDWGTAGLLQTPSARMGSAGLFSFNLSHTHPYTVGNVFVQPFDWMEAGFRYTDVSNILYGPPELSGSQSYKDKGFDVKFRLWPESARIPQIALGFRDIAGTGLFSSEYLVASKRTGDFDWSLGVGWGYIAGHPRTYNFGQGGNFNFGTYFTGPARPFGGVQWHTPWEQLLAKLEYDSNSYSNEPLGNVFKQSSPLNFGLVYRWGRSTDFTLGVERGNTVTLGVALHTQLDGLTTPKLNDPPRVPVTETRPIQPPDWAATAREINRQTEWNVTGIEQSGRDLRVTFNEAIAVYWRDRVDRAVAVLNRDAPASVDRFVFIYVRTGTPLAEHVIDRSAWVAQQVSPVPPSRQRETIVARAPQSGEPAAAPLYSGTSSRIETALGIGYTQSLGGPNAFHLYQIYAEGRAGLRIRDDTWLSGSLRLGLIDNYDKFTFTGPSNLPRVRTFIREYQTSSDVTMPNLQLTHFGRLSTNNYYSIYGGYLEEMYAGVGAEWLYRPFASRIAYGVDVNGVRQRGFNQDFSLRDYQTGTGHATLYWDTGWQNVLAKLSAGRYLAGDYGATVDLSRTFKNGVVVGAFAVKTNVSAQEYGEGSFTKGVYLGIPFDAILTKSSRGVGGFVWTPLTRDGGAMLYRRVTLYEITRPRSDRTLEYGPAPPPNDQVIPENRRETWVPAANGPEPHTRVTARPTSEQWRADSTFEYRLTEALYQQDFRNIRIAYDSTQRLTVTAANDRLHPISRAVGRAARTALHLAPEDAREIRIVFAERIDPVVIYDFFDLGRLRQYFNGEIAQPRLAPFVAVEYINPAARETNPLARLDDVDTTPPGLSDLLPQVRGPRRVADDVAAAGRRAADVDWLRVGAIGLGSVLLSSTLDDRIDQRAKDHAGSTWSKNLTNVGDAVPWLAMAGAALAAFDGGDPVRSRTGYAAAEAGATAMLVTTGLQYGVGRARPSAGLGKSSFNHFTTEDTYHSYPSRSTAVAWAAVTPFALEYNAPWLYGVAAVTNLGRIASRDHWFSDTVGGSLVGYGLGRLYWDSSRTGKSGLRVMVHPNGILVASDW